jgi:hypothetical protein
MSVFDVDDDLAAEFPVLVDILKYTKFAVVIAFCLAIFVGVIWLCVLLWEIWSVRNSKLSGLAVDKCSELDLIQIHALATEELTDVPNFQETINLYRHNKHCIKQIVDMRKGKRVVGYLVLLPLTKAGVDKIEQKTFSVVHDGLSVFGKRMPSKADYYIGAAVAPDRLSRAKAVQVIKEFCKNKRVTTIYARPTTERGLAALLNNNFLPVHKEDTKELGVLFFRKQ